MACYEKQIAYLDYIENGEKIKNGGFVKLLWQGTQLRISININGLHETDSVKCELLLQSENGEVNLDNILLHKGKCMYSCLYTEEELMAKSINPEKIYSIQIPISDTRVLKTQLREKKEDELKCEDYQEPELHMEEKKSGEIEIKTNEEEIVVSQEQEVTEVIEILQPEEQEIDYEKELRRPIEPRPLSYEQVYDDKWKQLEKMFPSIHPFGDKKEYLSVTPKDFVVLTKNYQPLANNSFLLHGYYNYHHIILGKIPRGTQDVFYIGVPGVYYEREKIVAVMFGFESFECAKEPAETGTFGYYMKEVEI